jgi:tripartite-type tricarboxylate transporter receptor subunit TctC
MALLPRIFIALVCVTSFDAAVAADNYPSKPVRLIVPFAPGGGADVAARAIGAAMGTALGQTVVVENKPGASNVVASQYVANAEADGYTLLWITDVHAINEAGNRLGKLASKLPYDSLKSFATVGETVKLQIALMASKASGITTMAQLDAKAKAGNGLLSAGHNGQGSPHYLAFLGMQQIGNYKLNDIPYAGSGPTALAVQSGEIDLAFGTVGSAVQLDKAQRVTLLAVSGAARDPLAPAVPTIAESGYPNFSIESWMGVVAPASVAPDRLAKLNGALNKALADPKVVEQLKPTGMNPSGGTREAFAALIARDSDKIEALYKASSR